MKKGLQHTSVVSFGTVVHVHKHNKHMDKSIATGAKHLASCIDLAGTVNHAIKNKKMIIDPC